MKYKTIVGVGNTATVYEWEENKVLKLFYKDYPIESIEKEFKNARLIWNMGFSMPKAYEIITYNKQIGIIYDRLKGESLLGWLARTGNVEECAVYMSNLHKQIIVNKINDVPDYKDFLRNNIQNAQSLKEKKKYYIGLTYYQMETTLFLVEYTPVPAEVKEKEKLLKSRKILADLYLMQMNVTRETIEDYLLVIIAARMGERPIEN